MLNIKTPNKNEGLYTYTANTYIKLYQIPQRSLYIYKVYMYLARIYNLRAHPNNGVYRQTIYSVQHVHRKEFT